MILLIFGRNIPEIFRLEAMVSLSLHLTGVSTTPGEIKL